MSIPLAFFSRSSFVPNLLDKIKALEGLVTCLQNQKDDQAVNTSDFYVKTNFT